MPRWDLASREKQRLLIEQQQPWRFSSGPKTSYGRSVASRNAIKKKKPRQLHSAFTPPKQTAAQIAHLKVGDRVCYVGNHQPTFDVCGDSPLEVVGFCQLGTGAIACRTRERRLIWIYPQDLERT